MGAPGPIMSSHHPRAGSCSELRAWAVGDSPGIESRCLGLRIDGLGLVRHVEFSQGTRDTQKVLDRITPLLEGGKAGVAFNSMQPCGVET